MSVVKTKAPGYHQANGRRVSPFFSHVSKSIHSAAVVGVMARVEKRLQSETNILRHKKKGLTHMCFYSQGGLRTQTAAEWEPTEAEKIDPRRVVIKKDGDGACLTFDQLPWLKLVYISRLSKVEIGGMCITESNDPLHVTDIKMVKAPCTPGHIEFDDDSRFILNHLGQVKSEVTVVWNI